MIRLGHINYSNCVPVHALLLDAAPADVVLVRDVPSRLNAALAAGEIDAAPCSSIEYARHAADYRILPDHAIGSAGPVQSILLESTVPLQQLDKSVVGIPTASATSVVLLRALLEQRLGISPRYEWFEQGDPADPVESGALAVLRIGDAALRRQPRADCSVYDLGSEWYDWTGLPFAFAVWQVRRDVDDATVARLVSLLAESRTYFNANAERIAAESAPAFGLSAARLLDYWSSLRFDLDEPMRRGLLRFYEHAAALAEAPPTTALDIVRIP